MSMSKTKYINKRSKQINIQHRHTFHTCLGVKTYYAVWHMKNTTKEYNMSSESVLKWRIYLNIMHICVYVVQGVFSHPSHKTNSQDRQEELCQSMLLSWRSSLCMRTYVHSITLSCARITYYPCPPLCQGNILPKAEQIKWNESLHSKIPSKTRFTDVK